MSKDVHDQCGYRWEDHWFGNKRQVCPDEPEWKPPTWKSRARVGADRVGLDDLPEPDPEDDVVDCPDEPPEWWPR